MSYCRLDSNSGLDETDTDSGTSSVDSNVQVGHSSEIDGLLPISYQTIEGPTSDETFKAVGYKRCFFYTIFYHIFGIFTFGLIYLVGYWRPDWQLYWKKHKSSLSSADTLLLQDLEGATHVVKIEVEDIENSCGQFTDDYLCNVGNSKTETRVMGGHTHICGEERRRLHRYRYFIFQYLKYIWNFKRCQFECVTGLARNSTIGSLMQDYRGYTLEEREERQILFGKNFITIEVKPYLTLLFTEILNPFYIFQIASIILWSCDEYYLYAVCIFIISCLSVGVSLYETRKQSESIQNMIEASNTNSAFVRSTDSDDMRKPVEIDAAELVPGDVIVIPPTGCVMACDALLISGNAIVNESMLTGESVPITKVPVTLSEETEIFSPEKHKRHTLFCGTTVIQTRYYGKAQVLAVVLRTGFSTAKGELVRSILYPRPMDFKFYKDSMKFICFLFLVALIGMSISLYFHIVRSKPVITTVVRTLDIVTIVVPPALPAAMTVGTYYAQSRLKKLGIFCISPPRINVCGKLKLVCFDKTGTLTEDGLEVWGVVGVENDSKSKVKLLGQPSFYVDQLDPKSNLAVALASCHSLTYINGEIIGDPLDLQMFKATKWSLLEPENNSDCYESLIPTIVRPPTPLPLSLCSTCDASTTNSNSLPDYSGNPCSFSNTEDQIDNTHSAPPNDCVGDPPSCGSIRKTKEDSELTIQQILQEMTMDATNYDEVKPTVVKPCGSDSYVDPPTFSDITETSFKVPYEIGIVRQFPFSSSVQRMSVIVRVLGSPYMELYSKGAPEVIQMLCRPETVPENFSSVLTEFTVQGFRVIALAHKNLEQKLSWHNSQRIKRNQIECDMTFIGLLILQNVLKPETTPVIHQLRKANIRTVMVTGDNILTGICVARDCGMVEPCDKVLQAKVIQEDDKRCLMFEAAHSGGLTDSVSLSQDKVCTNVEVDGFFHLAISGSVWAQIKEYFPEYVPYIVSQGTVFGRMSPDQKVQLIEELQKLQYVVGMCGDGANDCGALKAAHVGISLSEAEASVAAPFTSHTPNITCVPKVICEGRGALTTNFSVFKYMALYSIIQFVSVLVLYYACTNLSDEQFLYIDLFIVTLVAIFMGYTKANHKLVAQRPLSSLIGAVNLFSVVSQILWVIAVQIFAYYYFVKQPWYTPLRDCDNKNSDNIVNTWETNVIFCVSAFQYLALGVIYSPGLPFRKPLYTNSWLLITLIVLTATTGWLAIYPTAPVAAFMQLKNYPLKSSLMFRGTLVFFAFVHFILGWLLEYYIAGSSVIKRIFQFMSCKRQPKNLYKRINSTISEDPSWPPFEQNPIYSSVT